VTSFSLGEANVEETTKPHFRLYFSVISLITYTHHRGRENSRHELGRMKIKTSCVSVFACTYAFIGKIKKV